MPKTMVIMIIKKRGVYPIFYYNLIMIMLYQANVATKLLECKNAKHNKPDTFFP